MLRLALEALTSETFAPFGEVIDSSAVPIQINQGFAERFNTHATIDVCADGGAVAIAVFSARARPQPIAISVMERHPLGSQLFVPLQSRPWLVVVCTDPARPETYRAFRASGEQGVNYGRNVWHHPLLVLADGDRFLIVDRKGLGNNLEEHWLASSIQLTLEE